MKFLKALEDVYLPFALFVVLIFVLAVWAKRSEQEGFEGGSNGPYFFEMYYVDWCPHCQRAKPEFQKLGATQTIGGTEVICKMIDAKKNPEQLREKVRGFPTFQLWDSAGNKVSEYKNGNRTSRGFVQWLAKQL